MTENNTYPDLKINGRIFPLWILKNFKKYKLDPILKIEGQDPCNITTSSGIKELRKYQQFVGSYLDYRSPFRDILIYHGLGAGKTAAAVNIYNMLYNYNPGWNVFVLIKASLRDDPWLRDLKEWINNKDRDERMANIKFIHYDSPKADRDFMEAVKSADVQKKNIYMIEEAHNFIKNVYGNITSKTGRRAFTIYDYIQKEKKENTNTRVVLLSGTPAVNYPFEIALIFNLLRPDIFPMSETHFNEIYISEGKIQSLSPENKNMFQRRIMGLVSYYQGSTSDLFASKNVLVKKIPMDKYHQEVYDHYESIEEQLEKSAKARKGGSSTKVYKSYTRQASNFVFPVISQQITGDNRPRPGKFRLSEDEVEKIMQGKADYLVKTKSTGDLTKFKTDVLLYIETIKKFVGSFEAFLNLKHTNDVANNYTINDDIRIFQTDYKFKFKEFWEGHKTKSSLLKSMYACSCKMTSILFYMMRSKGPILVYSNYVKMEGLEIFKIYLKQIGFGEFGKEEAAKFHSYTEFHGEIDRDTRKENLANFNQITNKDGSIIRVILISPAGAEGISLMNVRQVHVMEPYWNEVRIEQLIGRAVRQCSHKALPMEDRKVDIYRYLATRSSNLTDKETTDQKIFALAKNKSDLIGTFLSTLKEVAVDCDLFKNHNMLDSKYPCFKFNEKSYFDGYIGPAYKDDIYYDKKIDNGLNSINSQIKRIKVIKIKAVYNIDNQYSEPEEYWFNPETGVIYDFELDYPIGKVYITNGIANKLDKDTYIMDQTITIPEVNVL
jgi:superfamily II DNA or RNA helicase